MRSLVTFPHPKNCSDRPIKAPKSMNSGKQNAQVELDSGLNLCGSKLARLLIRLAAAAACFTSSFVSRDLISMNDEWNNFNMSPYVGMVNFKLGQ